VAEPLSTGLYPDIAPHGSLAMPLRDLAVTHGLALGSVRACCTPVWLSGWLSRGSPAIILHQYLSLGQISSTGHP
jgi:hypothetical protein